MPISKSNPYLASYIPLRYIFLPLHPPVLGGIFEQFDRDANGIVDLNEFVMGTCQYLWDNQGRYESAEDKTVMILTEKSASMP